jgi:DNA-binding XRE family transcriptional regulator
MLSIENFTKAKLLDLVVLSQKNRKPDENPGAKLTDNQIAQIRLAYDRGGYTQAQLAERFGVSHQAVSKIVRGQRRSKQGGPTKTEDLRHAGEQDPVTGRFRPKAATRRAIVRAAAEIGKALPPAGQKGEGE